MEKYFDLNIEKVLDSWEPKHAVREIIANALDEQKLTGTKDIDIFKEGKKWHIRDYGRGLEYKHFTQNENKEKLEATNLIGKFGVGLKDALGVFNRKGIKIEINSKYAHISLAMKSKTGFNIETLHARFEEPIDKNFVGTDFIIENIDDDSINAAKSMFLVFNSEELLEETKYGAVYKHNSDNSSIYINGVQVATEENFMFSYNITNINAQIKKALNRERTNVGRTAYSDTIKNILTQCVSDTVLLSLVQDLENVMRGTNKDETGWVDVSTYAVRILNDKGDTVFLTPLQRSQMTNQEVEILNGSGKNIVLVTDNVFDKFDDDITTYKDVYKDYSESFEYEFVPIEKLNASEVKIYNEVNNFVLNFLKKYRYNTNVKIQISKSIRIDSAGFKTEGICDSRYGIIIKRDMLKDKQKYAGTLLHEFVHFFSNCPDNSREFENELTDIIGLLSSEILDMNIEGKKGFFSKIFK